MECKITLLEVLTTLCEVRLDLRLSQLLARYRIEWDAGDWAAEPEQITSLRTSSVRWSKGEDEITELGRSGYQRLEEQLEGSAPLSLPASPDRKKGRAATRRQTVLERERRAAFDRLWSVLSFDGGGDFVSILLDLTFYKHKRLVSAALALLVRQFDQRRVVSDALRRVQLLCKPEMVRLYGTFEELLRELSLLASRRQLYHDELYRAATLLGQLVAYCAEEVDDASQDERSQYSGAGGSRSGRTARSGIGRSANTRATRTSSDHTEGIYLILVGKARGAFGSSTITLTDLQHTRPLQAGDQLQLEGSMYRVHEAGGASTSGASAGSTGPTLTLNRPLTCTGVVAPELEPGGSGEVRGAI